MLIFYKDMSVAHTTISTMESVDTAVIGGGQAGLVTAYHLRNAGHECVILDAGSTIGERWQSRWDSLRLFTPAHFDGLSGMPFPGKRGYLPTKDEAAEYLRSYAEQFKLDVRLQVQVESLTRTHERFAITAGEQSFEADNVVVATGPMGAPRVPYYAQQLASDIYQVHSSEYRNPAELRPGGVLVVGAGNSGAEIALELAASHHTVLAGRDIGRMPVRPGGLMYRITNRLFTAETKTGKKFAEHGGGGTPVVRVTNDDLVSAGVERVPSQVVAAHDQHVRFDDEGAIDPENVIWATGFEPQNYDWITLPSFDSGHLIHRRGVIESEPGLYFVGLAFQHSFASSLLGGVSADAHYVVRQIAERSRMKRKSKR